MALSHKPLMPREQFCARANSYNIATLKQYGQHFKIAQMAVVRNKWVDVPHAKKNSVNTAKLDSNVARARSSIREKGLCNDWEQFVTLTLRPDDHDRYDLKAFQCQLSQFIRDLRKKTGADIRYLFVPEKHKNGAWHIHGLLHGLPPEQLEPFTLGGQLPIYIRTKLLRGEPIYNWPAYAAKFGYVTVEPLRDKDKAVSYITKYITKDLASAVSDMGAHTYYATKGLQHAVELTRGVLRDPIPIDYENEHCAITWFDADAIDAATLKGLFLPDYTKEYNQ